MPKVEDVSKYDSNHVMHSLSMIFSSDSSSHSVDHLIDAEKRVDSVKLGFRYLKEASELFYQKWDCEVREAIDARYKIPGNDREFAEARIEGDIDQAMKEKKTLLKLDRVSEERKRDAPLKEKLKEIERSEKEALNSIESIRKTVHMEMMNLLTRGYEEVGLEFEKFGEGLMGVLLNEQAKEGIGAIGLQMYTQQFFRLRNKLLIIENARARLQKIKAEETTSCLKARDKFFLQIYPKLVLGLLVTHGKRIEEKALGIVRNALASSSGVEGGRAIEGRDGRDEVSLGQFQESIGLFVRSTMLRYYRMDLRDSLLIDQKGEAIALDALERIERAVNEHWRRRVHGVLKVREVARGHMQKLTVWKVIAVEFSQAKYCKTKYTIEGSPASEGGDFVLSSYWRTVQKDVIEFSKKFEGFSTGWVNSKPSVSSKFLGKASDLLSNVNKSMQQGQSVIPLLTTLYNEISGKAKSGFSCNDKIVSVLGEFEEMRLRDERALESLSELWSKWGKQAKADQRQDRIFAKLTERILLGADGKGGNQDVKNVISGIVKGTKTSNLFESRLLSEDASVVLKRISSAVVPASVVSTAVEEQSSNSIPTKSGKKKSNNSSSKNLPKSSARSTLLREALMNDLSDEEDGLDSPSIKRQESSYLKKEEQSQSLKQKELMDTMVEERRNLQFEIIDFQKQEKKIAEEKVEIIRLTRAIQDPLDNKCDGLVRKIDQMEWGMVSVDKNASTTVDNISSGAPLLDLLRSTVLSLWDQSRSLTETSTSVFSDSEDEFSSEQTTRASSTNKSSSCSSSGSLSSGSRSPIDDVKERDGGESTSTNIVNSREYIDRNAARQKVNILKRNLERNRENLQKAERVKLGIETVQKALDIVDDLQRVPREFNEKVSRDFGVSTGLWQEREMGNGDELKWLTVGDSINDNLREREDQKIVRDSIESVWRMGTTEGPLTVKKIREELLKYLKMEQVFSPDLHPVTVNINHFKSEFQKTISKGAVSFSNAIHQRGVGISMWSKHFSHILIEDAAEMNKLETQYQKLIEHSVIDKILTKVFGSDKNLQNSNTHMVIKSSKEPSLAKTVLWCSSMSFNGLPVACLIQTGSRTQGLALASSDLDTTLVLHPEIRSEDFVKIEDKRDSYPARWGELRRIAEVLKIQAEEVFSKINAEHHRQEKEENSEEEDQYKIVFKATWSQIQIHKGKHLRFDMTIKLGGPTIGGSGVSFSPGGERFTAQDFFSPVLRDYTIGKLLAIDEERQVVHQEDVESLRTDTLLMKNFVKLAKLWSVYFGLSGTSMNRFPTVALVVLPLVFIKDRFGSGEKTSIPATPFQNIRVDFSSSTTSDVELAFLPYRLFVIPDDLATPPSRPPINLTILFIEYLKWLSKILDKSEGVSLLSESDNSPRGLKMDIREGFVPLSVAAPGTLWHIVDPEEGAKEKLFEATKLRTDTSTFSSKLNADAPVFSPGLMISSVYTPNIGGSSWDGGFSGVHSSEGYPGGGDFSSGWGLGSGAGGLGSSGSFSVAGTGPAGTNVGSVRASSPISLSSILSEHETLAKTKTEASLTDQITGSALAGLRRAVDKTFQHLKEIPPELFQLFLGGEGAGSGDDGKNGDGDGGRMSEEILFFPKGRD